MADDNSHTTPFEVKKAKKEAQKFGSYEKTPYLCTAFQTRAFSSVGLEHLPYKQRVGGSNPSTPTKKTMVCQFWHTIFQFVQHEDEDTRLLNIKKYHPQKQILHLSLFAFHFYFVPLHSL